MHVWVFVCVYKYTRACTRVSYCSYTSSKDTGVFCDLLVVVVVIVVVVVVVVVVHTCACSLKFLSHFEHPRLF